MQAQAMERVKAPAGTAAGVAAVVGAAALVVATVWFALADKGVTVSSPPQAAPDASPDDALRSYYHWFVTTLVQERWYTVIAMLGFLGVAAAAGVARGLFTSGHGLTSGHGPTSGHVARIGGGLVGAGAVAWIATEVGRLGGHGAVGQMATHANPIETVNSIAYTVDMISYAFLAAAFALIGAGLLMLASAGWRELSGQRAWVGCTALAGALGLAIAVAFADGAGDLTDVLEFAGGIVVLPLWLLWTGRVARVMPR